MNATINAWRSTNNNYLSLSTIQLQEIYSLVSYNAVTQYVALGLTTTPVNTAN